MILLQRRSFPSMLLQRRGRLPVLLPRRALPSAILQRRARRPMLLCRGACVPILLDRRACPLILLSGRTDPVALLTRPVRKGLTERALQLPELGARDPLRSTCLRERRSLTHDVRQMLDLVRRCSSPSCRAGTFQRHLGAVQFGRRQRTHARRATRPLDRSTRLIESRMPGRRGAAGDEYREQERHRGGTQRQSTLVQDTHGHTPGSGTAATRRDAAVLLLNPLAQASGGFLCLGGLRLDLGQLGIHQGLLREDARASIGLGPGRGMRRLQLRLRAGQCGRRMALGTGGACPRHGGLRNGQGFVRHGRLSASGKRHQDQRARDQASRNTLPGCLTPHAVCSPPPMGR